MAAGLDGRPLKRNKTAEQKAVEALDESRCRALIIEQINAAIKSRKYLSLRQAAKETRFLWILMKWRDALELNKPKDQEYWGEKVEEYCMERAKAELKIDGMEGANLLMEVVAKALIDQRAKRQITHDAPDPGK